MFGHLRHLDHSLPLRRGVRRLIPAFVAFLVLAPPAACPADDEQTGAAETAEERWEVIYMAGQRIGYAHTRSEETTGPDGETIFTTDMVSHMEINRFGGQLTMTIRQHTEETEDGRLLRFRFQLDNPPISSMQTVGEVVDEETLRLTTTSGGRTSVSTVDWDPGVKSPAYQNRMLSEDLPDEGETLTLETYEPTLNKVVTLTIRGRGTTETSLLDGSVITARKITIQMPELPPVDVFIDADGETVKTHTELPLLSTTTYRVDKETALEEIGDEPLDLAVATLVPVEPIPNAHETERIVYRIEVAGGGAAEYFAEGPTQSVREISDTVAEVTVTRSDPAAGGGADEAPDEYLESTRFLECTDERVVEHAEAAAGDWTDPVDVALAMEAYVQSKMTGDFATGLATASEIARELAGDCTEHAVLLAAMLRARSVPSRVSVGLVYSDRHSGFAGHMWTEAYLDGQWVPLDATLGLGGIGAAHIKVSDSSLAEDAPTPVTAFLPLLHLLGKMSIEVVEVE